MKKIPLLLLAAISATTFATAQEKIDTNAINKIKAQGLDHSKVMDIAFQLTDVNGPRLTNSPGYFKAANWAKAELQKWGLVNAALEPWGDFGKGWELKRSYIAMTAPYYRPLIGFPKTWTKGSGGLKNAKVIVIKAKDSAGLEQYRGKLKGMIVLLDRTDTLKPSYKPDANRYDDERLQKMAEAKPVRTQANDTAAERRRRQFANQPQFGRQSRNFFTEEGVLAILTASPSGRDGTVFVSGGGAYGATDPENTLDVTIAFEDFMSIVRLSNSGYPVQLDLDVQTEFFTKDVKGYNVVAEIKGSDPKLKDELVMLGGHLDSWQASTGATDNAAGCAVMMEAVRILKQSGLQPKRTIRIALWSGEEQGLLGSRGYVKEHFGDPATMQLKPEQAKVSAYFNLDNGSGKIRGIYTQGNEAVMPVFTQWLEPFNSLGAKTVTVSNTGGTDHLSFDQIGIPGFQFIQDELEYNTRTHHTNMDSYDHLSAADLKQAATIVAAFVYNTANRDDKLPRKELPKPRP
ncbi:M20/M25/M40 family metallo-hydrolase [Ferruginibacter sp. HRS2-29]|uniref:M20/M25/M40 family metallo-hydrolase n=1 Tax=Ferruginibacter sp. HRS2-29 TaxID=2487334 RepID=UPI0020CED317|nr:M20/M25/M40 family metallo-hydrolase [Ferruginibacter sp. HRS2-29]MCP9750014.1 M20/M25/M40 family metallo-hydrolase [Ferruginibacter sp. HRS2-29]